MKYNELKVGKVYTSPFKMGGNRQVKVIMLFEGQNEKQSKHFLDAYNKYKWGTCCSSDDCEFFESTEEEKELLLEKLKENNLSIEVERIKKYFEPKIIENFEIY